ncbi:MAG: 50S ribosomal protein L25 [Myxococcota bacterium]
MSVTEIEVAPRDQLGKGPSRKLRASGRVPGVLYGHKEQPVKFSVDPKVFFQTLRGTGMGKNTIFKVKGLGREATCLIKEMQQDPVRWDLLHLDFLEVRETDQVVVDIPVNVHGRAVGVVAGGSLQRAKRTLRVKCSPFQIPKSVELDVTPMQLGDTVRVGDVELPQGVEPIESARLAIVAVKESRRSRQQAAAEAQADGEES